MAELLGTFFASIVGGGATGILGVVVQRFFDLKNKEKDAELLKLKHSHELGLRNLDLQIMQKEADARTKVAAFESSASESVAETHAFAASFSEPTKLYEAAKPTPGQAWAIVMLDIFRGMVRPVLTLYLCVTVTVMYIEAMKLVGGVAVNPDKAYELINLIVGTVLYLCTTCVLWWFGTRNKQSAPKSGV